MRFIINAEPAGKGRPRVTTRAGFAHAYTPKKTKDYEKLILSAYQEYAEKQPKLSHTAPKALRIVCIYSIPKNTPKKRFYEALAKPVQKKPDIDNVVKIILDALTGAAWADDTQIIDLQVSRHYGHEGKIFVEIRDVDETENELLISRDLTWIMQY